MSWFVDREVEKVSRSPEKRVINGNNVVNFVIAAGRTGRSMICLLPTESKGSIDGRVAILLTHSQRG